jgi:SAM-dependent methyltransferase
MDQRDNLTQAYDQIYSSEGILHRDSFYLWLINLLNPIPGNNLLDISCGQGRLVYLAHKMGLNAYGIDFSMDGLKVGLLDLQDAVWSVGDGECLPVQDESFEYVTHIGSLEHYLNPELGAKEVSRVLKPDGKACVLVPNAFGLLGNIIHVWKTGDVFDDGQPLQRYGTNGFWKSLLTTNGLEVIKTYGWGEIEFPRNKQDSTQFIRHPQKIIRYIFSFFIPLNLTNHLVYLCTRR